MFINIEPQRYRIKDCNQQQFKTDTAGTSKLREVSFSMSG